MTRLYTAEETKAIRDKVINNYALPIIKKAFIKYPQLNSAYFAVAQYWNDGASDEVQDFILYSVLDVPDWKAFAEYERQTGEDYHNDFINIPNIKYEHYEITSHIYKETKYVLNQNFKGWTGELVASFAAFCKEDSHQEMGYAESYTPYALFRRSNKGIKVEIIGKMLRPWLDGIRPEDDT